MPVAKKDPSLSPEDYLQGELSSEIKHEYVDGQAYAMAGASPNHNTIAINLVSEFRAHLKNTPCRPFASDIKVKTPLGNYRYPDVLVVCDDDFGQDGYVTQTPRIIIEVISKSTRKTDEQIKRIEYINIPTLQEYVIVEQDYVDVAVFRRSDSWRPTNYFLGDEIHFESIDLTLAVEEIYLNVQNEDMFELLAKKQNQSEQ